jgi:hypothetical protein
VIFGGWYLILKARTLILFRKILKR